MNEKTQKQKKCTKCKVVKSLDCFGNDKYSKDGLKYQCRECINVRKRAVRSGEIKAKPRKFLAIDHDAKTRECLGCGKMLPWEAFSKTNHRVDGMLSRCKPCDTARNSAYYLSTREYSLARSRMLRNGGVDPGSRVIRFIDEEAQLKECSTCEKILPFDQFSKSECRSDGLTPVCKTCNGVYYQENKEHISERGKKYRLANYDEIKKKKLAYSELNREKIRQKAADYVEANRETVNRNKREAHRRNMEDPAYVTIMRLRNNFTRGFLSGTSNYYIDKYLGCTIESFLYKMEAKFYMRDDGTEMTWDNIGEWHYDHVVPISTINISDEDHIKQILNHRNFQPLWSEDNLSKWAHPDIVPEMIGPLYW